MKSLFITPRAGINMLKSVSAVSNRIMESLQKGIHVEARQNAMSQMKFLF